MKWFTKTSLTITNSSVSSLPLIFSHTKDGTHARTNVQSHTMQGIPVGLSDVANGMEIYDPITRQLYTTTVYKLDEYNNTKSHFNLPYDGWIYSGLFSLDTQQNIPEPYTIGTAVKISNLTDSSSGYVLAVPSTQSDFKDSIYTMQLASGETTSVPRSIMDTIVVDQSSTKIQSILPSWLHQDAKVRLTLSRMTYQGRLHLSLTNEWSFIKKNKLNSIMSNHPLPNFNSITSPSLILQRFNQDGLLQHGLLLTMRRPCPSRILVHHTLIKPFTSRTQIATRGSNPMMKNIMVSTTLTSLNLFLWTIFALFSKNVVSSSQQCA